MLYLKRTESRILPLYGKIRVTGNRILAYFTQRVCLKLLHKYLKADQLQIEYKNQINLQVNLLKEKKTDYFEALDLGCVY